MGWETRERGVTSYYYRSVRSGDRVRKEYVGTGLIGQIAAQLDEYERRQKEEKSLYWKEEKERLVQSAAFLQELTEAAEVLVRAYLLASGFHQHKGQWRRRQRGP
jgi:transposase